jgi:MraZ protein
MNMVDNVQDMAAMFVGSFTHTLDAKHRIIFPSSWRTLVGSSNRLFAFPHPDAKCLYLYTAAEMTRRLEQLRASDPLDRQGQQAIRSFTAGAEMLTWDAQGRVRIGENLLAHAEVKEQVVLVGTLTRIELWSVENFDLALPQDSPVAEDVFYGGY